MPGVRRLLDDIRTVATMPRVQIVLSRGSPDEEEELRRFRRRHPRLKIVGSKALGAALMPLDEFADADDYVARLRYLRRRVNRSRKLGYSLGLFDADDRRADLLAIHASLPERQGRPIDAPYLDPDEVVRSEPNVEYLGVWRDGNVVAYTKLFYAGDIAGMGRVMGHGDALDDGVMFLLMAGIIEHVKATHPQARYLFYDTFFGASEGLRTFKRNAGFRPYFVRWKRAAPRPAASLADERGG
jgi:hypothetical protein